jgi:hypothetical protein
MGFDPNSYEALIKEMSEADGSFYTHSLLAKHELPEELGETLREIPWISATKGTDAERWIGPRINGAEALAKAARFLFQNTQKESTPPDADPDAMNKEIDKLTKWGEHLERVNEQHLKEKKMLGDRILALCKECDGLKKKLKDRPDLTQPAPAPPRASVSLLWGLFRWNA